MSNLTDELSRRAAVAGHDPAILAEDLTLDFRTVEALVWSCATTLRRSGLAPGMTVGLAFSDQASSVIASLAAFRVGLRQIALPSAWTATQRQSVADQVALDAMLGDEPPAACGGRPLIGVDLNDLLARADRIDPGVRHVAPHEVALLVLGSGTTAAPKIIAYTQAQLQASIGRDLAARPIGRSDRHLSVTPVDYFTAKRRTLGVMFAGGAAVLSRGRAGLFDLCDRFGVNHLSLVVVQAEEILAKLPSRSEGPHLPRLKTLFVGSSPVSEDLRRRLRRQMSANTFVAYGSNEFGEATIASPAVQDAHPGAVGRPCPGVAVEIVGDDGRRLSVGEIGHVRLRGAGMFAGYHGQPEETARVLDGGWYRPGDLGSLTQDGVLVHHGRSDDMMILDGINIYPREIESVLETHPAVAEAAAFPVSSAHHGGIPAAAVTLRSAGTDGQELLEYCRERLGIRAPRHVAVLAALPRNQAGKILKRELSAMFREA